jgi:2-oxoisovalerate ferredoxin oxidoreductase alpha subunit
MKKLISGNDAAAYGALLSRVDVVSAYPITPQTAIVEKIASFIADGMMNAEYIEVESEHSALASCIGASYGGARVFTATSSHGLVYMHEMLHWAAHARLPIVMGIVNRSLGPPWAIWSDHQDSISQRDCGWIEFYVENSQEVLDTCIQAYKIAESEEIQLPIFFCQDAFILSHTYEVTEIPEQRLVDKFLPRRKPFFKMDVDNPVTFGNIMTPEWYMELKFKLEKSMQNARKVITHVGEAYYKIFGRKYGLIEKFMCEDAECILVTVGALSGTVKVGVKKLRKDGLKVGVVRIRSYRPFPIQEMRELAETVDSIVVLDRAIPMGQDGPICTDLKSAIYDLQKKPMILPLIVGIGGRPLSVDDVVKIGKIGLKKTKVKTPIWLNLKVS